MNARVSVFIASAATVLCCAAGSAATATAQTLPPQERLCDPTFEDCRADILQYIRQETVEIDMAYWMMTDARYSNELVRAWERGVKIRLLMDPRCGGSHPACVAQNDQLRAAGIPMRNRVTSGILHWKMALFVGQGQVQFAGANYAPFEMSPEEPFVNFTDEIVYFSNTPSIVQSFMTKFDDQWISTTEYASYANVTGPLARTFPIYAQDPELNFPPEQSYRSRALQAYAAEQQQIDVMMFRITDEQHTNAMLAAIQRGVPVRLITDETEYRNRSRLWDAYNVDKMYNAGVRVRFDGHLGINHEKLVLLRGTSMSIFGSSNWTSPSSDSQREHNMFTTKQWMYDWLEAQFERKWNNSTGHQETKPFVPLPPDIPAYHLPADGTTGMPTTGVTLSWDAGLWAHKYDIYFGTSPNPPLLEQNRHLGPSQFGTDYRTFTLPPLQPGTRYYWKIVSKTMAFVPRDGAVWSFTTTGDAPPPPPSSLPSGWSSADVGATGAQGTASAAGGTFTVTGAGADVWGTADAFHYAYRPLNGDGSITARVATIEAVNAWTKAGVMIRGSLSPSSAHGFMLVAASASKGVPFQRRTSDGNTSVSTAGPQATAPRWVRLVRAGNAISAFQSPDGSNWALVASDTFVMPATVFVGLAVSSHVVGANATATFDGVTVASSAPPPPNAPPTVSITNPPAGAAFTAPATIAIAASAADGDGSVTKVDFLAGTTVLGTDQTAPYAFTWSNVPPGTYRLTAVATDDGGASTTSSAVSVTVNGEPPPTGLPAGWLNGDVGGPALAGSAGSSGGAFSVTGSGADVWGSFDQFHYAYRALSGNGTITARVTSVPTNVHAWVKAGVMIRESLDPGSPHAFMLVSAAKGVAFQRRPAADGASVNTAGTPSTAPRWVRLTRNGDVFSAYESANGTAWTLVATQTIPMGSSVLIGIAVTSHDTGATATCTFDSITIQ
jgi:phosphatidylserine/phosphatidylglycerophosphate/cardiolipin synthase-like enzyme/regulation of enolase protein 1 (concanavalin A-like superfamily)